MKVDIKYKSENTIPWLTRQTKWWHLPSTRRQAAVTLHEVQTLRQRLSEASIEVSEWRTKVGEAFYSKTGPQFKRLATDGVMNRIGHLIRLTDEDFYPGR